MRDSVRLPTEWYADLERGKGEARNLRPQLRTVLLRQTAAIAEEQERDWARKRAVVDAAEREARRQWLATERARLRHQILKWSYPLIALTILLGVSAAIMNALASQAAYYTQADPDNALVRLIGYCSIPLFLADVPLAILLFIVGLAMGWGE